jgi:DNA-binding protein YbaB
LTFSEREIHEIAELNERRLTGLKEITATLGTLEGVGQAADGRIRATVGGGAALSGLTLDPRVMRMDSASLSEAIVEAVRAASQDLEQQTERLMTEVLGGSPLEFLRDPGRTQEIFDGIQADLRRSVDDIMARVDDVRRSLPG